MATRLTNSHREPLRLGLLSTAAINAHILDALRESTTIKAVAVASRTPERADEHALAYGIERTHGTYEALLVDPEIDAVYISLPNSLHVEWTVRALEAGKHVLCEKPLDRRPAAVERAFASAAAHGLILMEGFMYRHHPQTALFAELVATEIGELRIIRAAHGGTRSDPDDIRLRRELDGGALMDVGCYCVSIVRLLAGEPELAVGTQVLGPSGVDMRFGGLLRFSSEIVATIDCGFDIAPTAFVEATGSHGTVRVRDPFLLRSSFIELTQDDLPTRWVDAPAADSYRLECENFAAAIRGEREPLLGRDDAVGQARCLEALYRSAAEGSTPVTIL